MPLDSAEIQFERAFERLMSNNPEILPKGSRVSQNNVAKEAGCVPSALRKERFPKLIQKIQAHVSRVSGSKKNKISDATTKMDGKKNGTTSERIEILEAKSTSKVLSLLVEISELRANVIKLKSKKGNEDFNF